MDAVDVRARARAQPTGQGDHQAGREAPMGQVMVFFIDVVGCVVCHQSWLYQHCTNVSTSMMCPFLSLHVSSEGACRQHLCPDNARCCFRNFLELYRCLDKGGLGYASR